MVKIRKAVTHMSEVCNHCPVHKTTFRPWPKEPCLAHSLLESITYHKCTQNEHISGLLSHWGLALGASLLQSVSLKSTLMANTIQAPRKCYYLFLTQRLWNGTWDCEAVLCCSWQQRQTKQREWRRGSSGQRQSHSLWTPPLLMNTRASYITKYSFPVMSSISSASLQNPMCGSGDCTRQPPTYDASTYRLYDNAEAIHIQ